MTNLTGRGGNSRCDRSKHEADNPLFPRHRAADAHSHAGGGAAAGCDGSHVSAKALAVALYRQAVVENPWARYKTLANGMGVVMVVWVLVAVPLDDMIALLDHSSGAVGTESHAAAAGLNASQLPNTTAREVHAVGVAEVMGMVVSHGAVFWLHRLLIAMLYGYHGMMLWSFFFVALLDYKRKDRVMQMMATLVTPQLSVKPGGESVVGDAMLQLQSAEDVYAWLVSRRLLLNMGRLYNLRVEVFTSATALMLLLLLLGMLTPQLLAVSMNQHLSSYVSYAAGGVIVFNVVAIVIGLVQLVRVGSNVNQRNVEHRELITCLQLQSREQHARTFVTHRGRLQQEQGEEDASLLIAHHDSIDKMFVSALQSLEMCDLREPITILGKRANPSVLSSIGAAGATTISLLIKVSMQK
jgi:hypothetical protein